MKHARLIIVEGLPGSGKSTTAAMIAEELQKTGKKVVCMDEGVPNHPADYDHYDFPDFETEKKQILAKWREFAADAQADTTYVFNCIFLQNPMCETMMRFDMSADDSCGYIGEIADIIRSMNPIVLYLEQKDEKAAVEKVLAERGNDWRSAVIGYHTEQGYGKNNHLTGFDGYIACLEERQRRELYILEKTGLNYFTLSEALTAEEFLSLCLSAGWGAPAIEQIQAALKNTTKSFVIRKKDKAIAMINLQGDFGMHWSLKEFVVHPDYKGKMLGAVLYRFAENYIRSTLKDGWKAAIDLRSTTGAEKFYTNLGFRICPNENMGHGMEKMIENA